MELFRGILPEERVMLANPIKDKVHKGDPVFGTLLPVPSPEVVEILGLAGYDFVMLDMEHGPITVDVLGGLVRACRAVGLVPMARVPGVDVLFIGPSDLSQSLGHPGAPAHPDVQAAIRRIIGAGRAAGVPVGMLTLTPEDVRTYSALGATVFLDSLPRLLLRSGQGQVQGMREAAVRAATGTTPPGAR